MTYNSKKSCAVLVALMASTAPAQDAGFTLFDDYRCQNALPMAQVDGGWWASDARKQRIDCALAGAQGELNEWRPHKTDIAPTSPAAFQLQVSHGVIGLLTAVLTTYLAVVKTRADQHCRGAANPFGACN
jgi:hypothetical protein